MPTFNHIGGAEPSTLTFKLATVSQTINSSVMHKEVQVIGDPDSSVAIASVLNTSPASTAWALSVRQVGAATVSVSNLQVIDENPFSTAAGTGMVDMGVAFSGAIASVGNGQNAAKALDIKRSQHIVIRDAALNARGANVNAANALQVDGQSTCIQGTSPWVVSGASTVAPLAGSTWNTRPLQSSAADLQMTATPAAGSTWRTQPGSTLWASSAGFHFDSSGALQVAASFTGSTGPLTISQLLDSSGGSVTAADSANNAIRVNVVAGAAGGSTIVTISTVQGRVATMPFSTVWASSAGFHFDSSGALQTAGQLSGTVGLDFGTMQSSVAPAGGSSGLIVRIAGGPSSAVDCAIRSVLSSTAADNPVVATIGTNLQSSVAPSSGSSGLVVRQVWDAILTTASTNAFAASTSLSIQTSGAALRSYVTAYSILSTNGGPHRIKFYSSGTMTWPVVFAAITSGVSGANLANYPYIFRTAASEALTLQIGSGASTIAGYQVAVSYFRAP